jgi:hypothetical protein
MLGLADPSSRQFTDPHPDGTIGLDPLPESARVGIEVLDGAGRQIGKASRGYVWEPWQRVAWHERRKAGWATLRAAFAEAVG